MSRVRRLLGAGVCILSAVLAGCAPAPTRQAVEEIARTSDVVIDQDRDVAVLEWGVELGLAEPFTAADLSGDLAASAPPSYGAQHAEVADLYRDRVDRVEDAIRSEIRDGLSATEVRGYYDAHPDRFARTDTVTVEIVPWQDGRAGEPRELTIDENNARTAQEGDDAVVAAALTLAAGEETSVPTGPDGYVQVRCLAREPGGIAAFDAVVQAAASQLAGERFEAQLARRIDTGR